jgi:hypothetical protein
MKKYKSEIIFLILLVIMIVAMIQMLLDSIK